MAASVYRVPGHGDVLFYGGHLAPKNAANAAKPYGWLALTLLNVLYALPSGRFEPSARRHAKAPVMHRALRRSDVRRGD